MNPSDRYSSQWLAISTMPAGIRIVHGRAATPIQTMPDRPASRPATISPIEYASSSAATRLAQTISTVTMTSPSFRSAGPARKTTRDMTPRTRSARAATPAAVAPKATGTGDGSGPSGAG
ncbi:hypothetical protein GCM10009558_021120 [Virgisporangium aurantiacum]